MAFLRVAKDLLRPFRRPLFEALGSERYSHLAINDLDRKLKKYLDFRDGFFIEAGANDGLRQSNTYWFERFRGWRGLLIEAVPANAELCRSNRPRSSTVNTALVASEETKTVRIRTADLMAHVSGTFTSQEEQARHHAYALEVQSLTRIDEIEVPASTLDRVLSDRNVTKVDLFSLDVEGFELDVLKGLRIDRNRPRFILVETKRRDEVVAFLGRYYDLVDQFSSHDYLLRCR
jgi:FkbM family methyltransferase